MTKKNYKIFSYRKNTKSTYLLVIYFLGFFFLISGIMLYRLVPHIEEISVSKLQRQLTYIVNEEIYKICEENNFDFEKYYIKNQNHIGKSDIITLDTSNLNVVKTKITLRIIDRLEKAGKIKITLPIGGIISSGKGIMMNLRLLAVNAVTTDFDDSFESKGFNHTRHTLGIKINIDAKVLMYGKIRDVKASTSIPVYDSIILGEVPDSMIVPAQK